MSEEHADEDMREGSVILLGVTARRREDLPERGRGRHVTRQRHERRSRTRSRSRGKRPSRPRSRLPRERSRTPRKCSRTPLKRSRALRERSPSSCERSRSSRKRLRSPGSGERTRRRRYNTPSASRRERRRKRRSNVSASGSYSSSDDRTVRSCRSNSIHSSNRNVNTFTLQDVMDLMKSLPSSTSQHLEEIQLGLNTTLNKAIGNSPAEVLFGTRLKTKGDGLVASLIDQEGESASHTIDDVRYEVNMKIQGEQQKNKERFDRVRKIAKKYEVGDLVRIERDINSNNGKSKKLLPKLQGPYKITKVLDMDRYLVEDTPITRKQNRKYEAVIAVDKIHPWLTFTQDVIDSGSESDDSDVDMRGVEDNNADEPQGEDS